MEKYLQVKVLGKVQGVGFRFCCHLAFVDLELKGKVENLPDGSLLVHVVGTEDKLERLVKWLHKGPEGAVVEKVEVVEVPVASYVEEKKG